MIWGERAGKLGHEVEGGEDGHGEEDQFALARGGDGIVGHGVDGAHAQSSVSLLRGAAPAGDGTAKARCTQGEAR